jgi:two-component system, OmpR family, alkaline phosphatase synthesis response regulator PhoP
VVDRPVTILVVDDEQPLTVLIARYLEREGYRPLVAHDGREALDIARRESPDLVVLDLMLPEIDGLEVCRQLRQFSDAYVLMLTARAEEIDRVVGLSVGADDYVTKPFSPRELVARIRAMLRRPRQLVGQESHAPLDLLRFDDLLIDLAAHEVCRGGEPISLTPLEFRLLETLSGNPGLVHTRAQLLEQVWGGDFYGDDHVVDVHISNLRRKLEPDPGNPQYIETVRGVGYRFRRGAR